MEKLIYKALINARSEIGLTATDLEDLDFVRLGNGSYHFLLNNKSYKVDVESIDRVNRAIVILINDRRYEIEIKNEVDLRIGSMGLDKGKNHSAENLRSPMPGIIQKIYVKEGETIKKDDDLVVLEAMKMENVLKAPHDTTVGEILVKEGDPISKNQELIKFK